MAKRDRKATAFDGEDWFDPWLMADNTLLPVVAEVAEVIEANRKLAGGLAVQSHRREVFNGTVSALVANLAFVSTATKSGWIAIHMPTQWQRGMQRYASGHVPVNTLKMVLAATEGNILDFRKGRRGVSSTIRPRPAFFSDLTRHDAFAGDVVRRGGEELIILSKRTEQEIEKSDGTKEAKDQRQRVPYEDDAATIAMRAEVDLINEHLAAADLAFTDDGEEPRVNVNRRRLRRHFNLLPEDGDTPRFDQGGRLFGAFWSNLDRERRRASLRIDGEPIAEVDFNAMFTRLAYAKAGEVLGDDDPYTPLAEELDEERGVIKQAVNAFFFKQGIMKNWPIEIAMALRHKTSVKDMVRGVIQHLPHLEPFLGTTVGYGFMRTESDIILASMKQLITMGITALPLHDAALVASSKAMVVKQVLEETGQEITGVRLPVSVKQGPE